MKQVILAFLLVTIYSFQGTAQQIQPCGTNEALESLHTQFPELKKEYDARMLLANSAVMTKGNEKAISYQIPVVFHILHEYGAENISDANVYAVMNRLNEDYNATNADTATVIPVFKPLIGNAEIQFKLAAIDPLGNCTNGIEHIYSHETSNGDVFSKINQWNRAHYLNIWVVNSPNSGGNTPGILLGYATFPTSTDGNGFWTDGIVLRDWTVSGTDRTLTHEVGHYLGLAHTFGNTNAGDGTCGDDGVIDTPPTDGSFSTCNVNLSFCDTPIVENIQNYMDYSSCTHMFTIGQVAVMHNSMAGIAGERDQLSLDSTLIMTGVKDLVLPQDPTNPLTVPLCAPIADYTTSSQSTCVGSPVTFTDASWNAVIDSRTWTFQDGTPATSTATNPSVTFNSPGYKTVTLSVTNAAGTGTETRTQSIYVYGGWGDFSGPTSFNLEGNSSNFFTINNFEDNYSKFQISSNGGYNNSKAFKLNNYKDVQFAPLFTNDFFYNNRLGGSVDELITPTMDLRYTSGVVVSFKYAFATNGTSTADVTETFKVLSSKDCGQTWQVRKTIPTSQLLTAGFAGDTDFKPSTNSQWKEITFAYNPTSADDHTIFKFQFESSDLSSNLWIDEINISGTLSLTDDVLNAMDLNVYPNPTTNGQAINVSFNGQDVDVNFTLRNAQGQVLSAETVSATNAAVEHTLENSSNLSAGCYFVEISSGDYRVTRKVVVL